MDSNQQPADNKPTNDERPDIQPGRDYAPDRDTLAPITTLFAAPLTTPQSA